MNHLNKIITTALVTFALTSFADDCGSLSGEYIIGPSEMSDFSTISAAADALNCGGVEGPVTFYIEGGTYNERVVFSSVSGASAFNAITFTSQPDAAEAVVISYAKSDATMVLTGSSFITFENITVDHGLATYGNCMRIDGEAANLSFKKVTFNGIELPRTGATNATVYCTPAAAKTAIMFEECEINGGSIGICKGGASATARDSKTTIARSLFFNQTEAGIALTHEDAPVISHNTINTLSANGDFKGISLNDAANKLVISRNVINTLNSARGLLMYDCMASSSAPAQILDNTFGIGGSRNTYGIEIGGASDNQVIDFNTIKMMVSDKDASTQAYVLNSSTGKNISLLSSTYYNMAKGSYMVYSDSYKSETSSKASSSFSASAEGTNLEKGVVIK